MSEKKSFQIFIDLDNEGLKKFILLDPVANVGQATDNIYDFYLLVSQAKEKDKGESNFEFYDGIDLLFIEIANVEIQAYNLLNEWTPRTEDNSALN